MSAERYTPDTNVLVYAVERSEGRKHELAVEIVNRSIDRPCVLTLQALAEFVAVITRKRADQRCFAIGQARDWLALFSGGRGHRRGLQGRSGRVRVDRSRFATPCCSRPPGRLAARSP